MKVGKIPEGMDPVDAKKKIGVFLKSIQQDSKPEILSIVFHKFSFKFNRIFCLKVFEVTH